MRGGPPTCLGHPRAPNGGSPPCREQKWVLAEFCTMNGHAFPLDLLVTGGTGPTAVSKTMKAALGAGAPSAPQARSIAGVWVEASGRAQGLYAAMKQGLLPSGLGLCS